MMKYLIILLIPFCASSYNEDVEFGLEKRGNTSILSINLRNTTEDTLYLTPKENYTNSVYEGNCEKGYLDFIHSVSGINLSKEKIFIDDHTCCPFDLLLPGESISDKFRFKPNKINDCIFVYRVFNRKKAKGIKYEINLNQSNGKELEVNKVLITNQEE